jgi:uncharacterized protein YoxC
MFLTGREAMIQATIPAGAWLLLQQAVAPRDTQYMVQLPSVPSTFDRVAGVAGGLLTIAFLVFTVVAVPALWKFYRSFRRIEGLLDRVYADIFPIMRHASNIADNVDYVTTSVRTDMQQLNATIAAANQRLHQAVALTERRMNEFSALLEVVQHEAEQMFVSTASAVHGVRTTASAFAGSRGAGGAKLASSMTSDIDHPGEAEAVELETEYEEITDGYDRIATSSEDDSPRPRVRPRGRRGDWA